MKTQLVWDCTWRLLGCCVLLTCAALGSTAASAKSEFSARVKIDLPSRVEVKKRTVSLGEVAGISTSDLGMLRTLMALPLGSAPRPGESINLRREELARWIRRRTGLASEQVSWVGGSSIEISTATHIVQGNQISHFAESVLQDWLQQRSESFHTQIATTPMDLSLPSGTVSFKTRPLSEMELRKRMSVWVDVYLDEVFVRTVPVAFDITAWVQTAVALRDAPAGEPIGDVDVAIKRVDIAAFSSTASAARNGVYEKLMNQPSRLRRAVKAGDVLTYAHFENVPTVMRGDWVKIQAVSGLVMLESEGAALQDGRKGQVIQVKPSKSVGVISARVMGPGLLEIQQ